MKTYAQLAVSYAQESKEFDKNLLQIPLNVSSEQLVDLTDLFAKNSVPVVFAPNELTLFYLRETVAYLLLQAAKYFEQNGYVLQIDSAYRKLSFQKTMFLKRVSEMKVKYPDKSEDEILLEANTYTAGIPILAAHTAGAAVDVSLVDKEGKSLDFGVPYNHGGIESITDFALLSQEVKHNRKILKEGMEKFGFVNYPFEYWHYSIGDVCATYLSGQETAYYDPVDFDLKTGEIVPHDVSANNTFFGTSKKYQEVIKK